MPTVIILHHPPVDTGIEWMSALPDEQWVRRLEAIVRPASQVICLIAGHVHRPIATSFAGKPLIVAPSTAPQVALDLDAVDPQHPDGRALIIADSPGYALHYWDGRVAADPFRDRRPAQRPGQLQQQFAADDARVPQGARNGLTGSGRGSAPAGLASG